MCLSSLYLCSALHLSTWHGVRSVAGPTREVAVCIRAIAPNLGHYVDASGVDGSVRNSTARGVLRKA